ncbi:MAG: hypothetical protein ABSE45_15095 [Candidatus Acidiferrales bacterium]|jgi:hypothetical protein
MLAKISKYAPTWIPAAIAVLGVVAQASQQYLTTHPVVTVGGLMGALGMAIVNHWIRSPRQ